MSTYLSVPVSFSPSVDPVLEAVAPGLSEDVVPSRVSLHLTLHGLLHLRVEKTVQNGKKYALKSKFKQNVVRNFD